MMVRRQNWSLKNLNYIFRDIFTPNNTIGSYYTEGSTIAIYKHSFDSINKVHLWNGRKVNKLIKHSLMHVNYAIFLTKIILINSNIHDMNTMAEGTLFIMKALKFSFLHFAEYENLKPIIDAGITHRPNFYYRNHKLEPKYIYVNTYWFID